MSTRVLVDALAARSGGGETLLVNQVKALSARDDLDLTVYATDTVADRLAQQCRGARIEKRPARRFARRVIWEQLVLPVRARRYDVIYLMGNFALLGATRPQVVLLQNAYHFGAAARAVLRRVGSRRFRLRMGTEAQLAALSVRRAERVVAVSNSLRDAVEEDLRRTDHLEVITSASPSDTRRQAPETRERQPYVLAVGHDLPHKDWDGLINAFLEHPDLPPLLLVGAWRSERRIAALTAVVRGPGGNRRVEFRGPVNDRDVLADLYRRASCVVAHSHLESFGFTPLEALVFGIPVAASDIPAHREVCGEAVDYYRPTEPGALAAAVRRALQRGKDASPKSPATRRTWRDNATDTARVLSEAAQGRRRARRHAMKPGTKPHSTRIGRNR